MKRRCYNNRRFFYLKGSFTRNNLFIILFKMKIKPFFRFSLQIFLKHRFISIFFVIISYSRLSHFLISSFAFFKSLSPLSRLLIYSLEQKHRLANSFCVIPESSRNRLMSAPVLIMCCFFIFTPFHFFWLVLQYIQFHF